MSFISSLKKIVAPRNPLRLAWHDAKSIVAAIRYRFPARELFVIGITGTDGKTTTASMVTHILEECGKKVGSLTTAAFSVNRVIKPNATQKTSPSHFMIQRFLRNLATERCEFAVLEYSSHGIDQGRMNFTWPKVAAITNLTAEHLDYHGTMEDYQATKKKLMKMLGNKGTKVLNLRDRTFDDYRTVPSERTIIYSSTPVDEDYAAISPKRGELLFCLTDIVVNASGSTATLHMLAQEKGKAYPLVLNIAGAHNLENALCAIGAAMGAGISVEQAVEALITFKGVSGRMETIDAGQPFRVFVDFTVTPASYEKTLSTLKSMLEPSNRLLVLTGSCGDRMKEKRPVVGKICSDYADIVVVTNEDPYTEDPETIIDSVMSGVDTTKTEAHKIVDRTEAIQFLFNAAKPGDIVILCGKGSDTTMWTAKGKVPWNEKEIAKKILAQRAA